MAFTAIILCNPNHAYITAPVGTSYPPQISSTSTTSSTYNPSRTTTTRTTTTTTITSTAKQTSQPNPTTHHRPQSPYQTPPPSQPHNPTTPPHTPHPPLPTQTPNMCQYTYTLFSCGHGNHIFAEDIELCPTQRLLSPYGPSPYDGLECPASVGICEGVNDWLCDECTEVWDLEAVCERE